MSVKTINQLFHNSPEVTVSVDALSKQIADGTFVGTANSESDFLASDMFDEISGNFNNA